MQLDQIAATAVNHLLGRLMRRAAVAAIMLLFILIAIYQSTVAGTIALEMRHGAINAHIIVAGIYLLLALVAFVVFWAMRARPVGASTPAALSQPREMQLIMLAEAVMLGYSLARKNGRAR